MYGTILDPRRLEQERRYLLMEGAWRQLAERRIIDVVGEERWRAWPNPDLSANALKRGAYQLSVLYDRAPSWTHPATARTRGAGGRSPAERTLDGLFEGANFAGVMQVVQPRTVAIGDYALRYEVTTGADGQPQLTLHPVSPHLLEVVPSEDDPRQPVEVTEAVVVPGLLGAGLPEAAVGMLAGTRRWTSDTVELHLPGREPEVYRHGQGACPWVLYHAEPSNGLWSPLANMEVVEGTLNLAVMQTMALHATLDASFPQRSAIGLQLAGSESRGDGTADNPEVTAVTPDPAKILLWQPMDGVSGGWSLHQWQPGMDVGLLRRLIADYQDALLEQFRVAGISARRTSDGNAPSGMSLVAQRDAQRELQRRFATVFRPYDERLAQLVSRAYNLNRGGQPALPEDGWRIRYRAIQPSPEEVGLVGQLLQLGLVSRAAAVQMIDPFVEPEELDAAPAQPAPQPAPPAPPGGTMYQDDEDDEVTSG